MSNTSDQVCGLKEVKSLEKNSFSNTCNMLSQYLKERGNFRDLDIRMSSDLERKGRLQTPRQLETMDLLERMKISMATTSPKEEVSSEASHDVKSMDLFPLQSGFGSLIPHQEDSQKQNDFRPHTVSGNSPLTMIYSGKVFVFDNFPTDKAREIVLLARRRSAQNSHAVSSFGNFSILDNEQNHVPVAKPQPLTENQPDASDLPIARKNSLHRFLEKRKGRISAKAPYQTNDSTTIRTCDSEKNKTWLGLSSND